MADKDLELDLGSTETPAPSKKKWIIIGVLGLLLIGAGVAAFFLLGDDSESQPQEESVEEIKKAIYVPLRPSFVVNFTNTGGKTKFLQVEVSLMGRDPVGMKAVEDHLPLLKSRLVEVFQSQEFEEIRTIEGKQMLRAQALEELQTVLSQEAGDPTLENLYFTRFVLQ